MCVCVCVCVGAHMRVVQFINAVCVQCTLNVCVSVAAFVHAKAHPLCVIAS